MLNKLGKYPIGLGPVNSTRLGPVNSLPVRGQTLAHKKNWLPHEREFWAADFYIGVKHLVEPTLGQCQSFTGAGSLTGVWWAVQRQVYRAEIMREEMPLVPARAAPKANGTNLVNLDVMLAEAIRQVGLDRTLATAVQVERHLGTMS